MSGSTLPLPNTNPDLGPLADNGGPTFTHALLAGSPAIDTASDDCPPPITDQRGVTRPQGPACDIGAYELAAEGEPKPTPTPTPTVAAAAQLPATGGEPSDGGSGALPWVAVTAGALALMGMGSGLWLGYQRRRLR